MKITKYPDGTSYVTIPKEWEDTTQEITFKMNTYEDVIHLAQLCDVLMYNRVKAHITIPCLLDAQADKRFGEFDSSGLAVIARILDNYVDGDNISIGVFHPHNPEVLEALLTSVDIVDNTSFITKVLALINESDVLSGRAAYKNATVDDRLILMSADAGGFKPLMKMCDEIAWRGETFSASKARKYVSGKSSLSQVIDRKDFGGKDVMIVDDISIGGGTFKGLATELRKRNVGRLYLAVSHMTVENLGSDPVTNYFDHVFTTNSKFDHYYASDGEGGTEPDNLTVIKIF